MEILSAVLGGLLVVSIGFNIYAYWVRGLASRVYAEIKEDVNRYVDKFQGQA